MPVPCQLLPLVAVAAVGAAACAAGAVPATTPAAPSVASPPIALPLPSAPPPVIDCSRSVTVEGWSRGHRRRLTLVMADGQPVELATATAFARLQRAAASDGVWLGITSGFRSMEAQTALWNAYRAGSGSLAARPGHSAHQSGHALDLDTLAPGVEPWLVAHARAYGFRHAVPSEPWHWEYWGRAHRDECAATAAPG